MLTPADVYKFIDQFEQSGKQIASVDAPTGTGKSTMFPKVFYEKGLTMFLAGPTVVPTLSLAKYVKTLIPSDAVGTGVEGLILYHNKKLYPRHSSTTPIVFVTAGHLKNILLRFGESRKPIEFVDYAFVDESHSLTVDYSVIFYMYAYLSKIVKESKDNKLGLPKLLLVTATPGIYPFKDSEIFPGDFPKKESLPVEIKYHHRDYKNLKGKDYKDLFIDAIDVIVKTHENTPIPEDNFDAWAVFCDGKSNVTFVTESLKKRTHNTIIIPLYSSMEDENALQYDLIPPNGFRKIVVSTNIIEASLTVEHLSYVFDTLVEKITMQSKTGGTVLQVVNITKSSARQRKGRTGRTRPGTCYRFCTEPFFESLPEKRLRDISRISPDGMILDLLSRNLKIEEIVIDNAIEKKTLENTKKRLASIGLLTDDMENISTAGDWSKTMPLSPRCSEFFWLFVIHSSFNPYIGAVLTAILETHQGGTGYFYVGDDDPPIGVIIKKKFLPVLNEFKNSIYKTSFVFNIHLILYIIESFRTIEIPPFELKRFCANNNLNNAKVKDCFKIIRLLLTRESRGPVSIGKFNVDHEVSKARPYLYQCYSDISYTKSSKNHKINSEIDSFLSKKDEISPKWIILPLSMFETPHKIFVGMYEVVERKNDFKVSFPKIRYNKY